MQGSARKDVVFGAARMYTMAVPGPKRKSWFTAPQTSDRRRASIYARGRFPTAGVPYASVNADRKRVFPSAQFPVDKSVAKVDVVLRDAAVLPHILASSGPVVKEPLRQRFASANAEDL